jgi:hypothetical protein
MKKQFIYSFMIVMLALACNNLENETIPQNQEIGKSIDEKDAMSIGKTISIGDAKAVIDNYQKTNEFRDTKRVFFGSEVIKSALKLKGIVGLGFYFAKNNKGEQILIMKALDINANELSVNPATFLNKEEIGGVIGTEFDCPPRNPCKPSSNASRVSSNETSEEKDVRSIGWNISAKEAKLRIDSFQKIAKSNETERVFFGTDIIVKMVELKGLVGFGFYFAKNSQGNQILVMKALDKNANELNFKDEPMGGIVGTSMGCPPRPPCNI